SVGRKSESQSSFPFAIHLSMNHTDSLGAKQLFTPLRFRCQQVFSFSRKFFFRGPVGATRWREGDLCLIFKPASRTFFAIQKISFPSPFRTWPARWRERLYAPFRPHRQAFFRKKSKKCFRTVKKALPRRAALFFNQLFVTVRLPPEKVKRFMAFFIQYICSTDKSNKNIMI
ncbi:hypothetical protein, partial [uncultured Desulfovibrio sp.]|uniref:hypothetical protein n=1 Tax=uncultured Desulfovibrio sp. TaxID=167968 RepID=UPI0026344FFA